MVETENVMNVGDMFRPRYEAKAWRVKEVALASVVAVDDEGNERTFATSDVARYAGHAAYADISVGEKFRPAYGTKLWAVTAVRGDEVDAVDDEGSAETFHKSAIPSL